MFQNPDVSHWHAGGPARPAGGEPEHDEDGARDQLRPGKRGTTCERPQQRRLPRSGGGAAIKIDGGRCHGIIVKLPGILEFRSWLGLGIIKSEFAGNITPNLSYSPCYTSS